MKTYPNPHSVADALCAADVKEREVTWIVPGLIPENLLTIMDGDPGEGKSFMTLELAATLSTGRTLSAKGRVKGGAPRRVLIANAEDEIETTMVPRLRALGANLMNVFFLGMMPGAERPQQPYLPEHIAFFEQRLRQTQATVLIVDPIMSFLSPFIKANSDQAVRVALGALQVMAREFKVTVVMVRHLNKGGGPKALYRGGGSIGIIGLCRAGLYVGPNPEDASEKILALVKSNLGPKQKPWGFKMVCADANDPRSGRKILWLGERDIDASRLLSTREVALPIEKAEQFLKELFRADKPVLVKTAVKLAEERQISFHTLKRAKVNLGIGTVKIHDAQYWTPAGYVAQEDSLEALKRSVQLPFSR